jgi:hypothetical protein
MHSSLCATSTERPLRVTIALSQVWLDYPHQVIKHTDGTHVVGTVHANTTEGFWSIFKRGAVGTFHKVSRKYLLVYVAEFQFRYNNRENDDIFATAITGCLPCR